MIFTGAAKEAVMRVLATFLAVTMSAPVMAAGAGPAPLFNDHPEGQVASVKDLGRNCPRTTNYMADRIGQYRGQRLAPRKLTELPPAIGYMAVYRVIEGCEAPMTMVEYRNSSRR
jgi:hypothetical protein